jgi:hypothetical protein
MAIIMSLIAQRMEVKRDQERDVSGGTVADVGDEDDSDRAREREGACLASSWCLGGAQGRR